MKGIFISYRREDSAGYAGRLYDRLAAHFGPERVFMDVEGIEPGTDFVDVIEKAVGSCQVMIAIIGDDWLATDRAGKRRLDDASDFVRIETVTALSRGIRVVPVLVEGAVMPRADQLPPDLAPLVRRQAVELSHKQWEATSGELIKTLEKILHADGEADAQHSTGSTPDQPEVRSASGAAASESALRSDSSEFLRSRQSRSTFLERPKQTPSARTIDPIAEAKPQPEPRSESQLVAIATGGNRNLRWIVAAFAVVIAGIALYLWQPWRDVAKPPPRPGHLTVSTSRLEFPDQLPRVAGSPVKIVLANDGESPLRVGSPRMDGAVADFVLSEDQCSGRELAPAASCSIAVAFSAQGAGVRSATLAFTTDPPNPFVISVQGKGIAPVDVAKQSEKPRDRPPETPRDQPSVPKAEIPVAAPRILNFQARVLEGKVQLCYGVENAESASITPSPGVVKPIRKECVPVAADATRTYTLTARNSAGTSVTRALTVEAPTLAQTVAVPDLIGKPVDEALAAAKNAGLVTRLVKDELDPQAAGPVNTVVAQLPKGGTELKIGERLTLQIMPASARADSLPSTLPREGDAWTYQVRSIWKNVEPRTYTHQVNAVSEREVREILRTGTGDDKVVQSQSFNPDTRFVTWRGSGYSFVEFNPFLAAFGALQPGTTWKGLAIPVDDPFFGNWYTQGRALDWGTVSVPAGTFKAIRVEINSNRPSTASAAMRGAEPVRILHVIWFSPEVRRTVKFVRTVYSSSGSRLDEDTHELTKYRLR